VNSSDPFGLCREGISADSAKTGGKRTTTIYCSDSTVETRKGGSPGCRNNNPGNLRGSPLQAGKVGGFAVFGTRTVGHEALWRWVQAHAASGSTLRQMIETYAPSSENNTTAYVDYVSKATGLDPNATVSTLEGTVQPLVNSIERYEGWNSCSVSVRHE
jgi:hypothetical protein